MADDEMIDAYRRVSIPAGPLPSGLTRRTFMKIAMGGLGLAALPDVFRVGALSNAVPLGPTEGVLIIVLLGGGNDGLNTVVPIGDSAYYDLRGNIAIQPGAALPLAAGVGLHPSLGTMKAHFDAGRLALVQGAGYNPPDLSHFNSMAYVMSGLPLPLAGPPSNGWAGRLLDHLAQSDANPLLGVAVGSSVPLHLRGAQATAAGLPDEADSLPGADRSDPEDARRWAAVEAFGAGSTGLGPWGDALAHAGADSMRLAGQVWPSYEAALPDDTLTRKMVVAARLINADLGIRVIGLGYGDYDQHADLLVKHGANLSNLDAAVNAFYRTINPAIDGRVTIMTFSEFGRRPKANTSGGVDHGSAQTMMVLGSQVNGGLHGALPSLTGLDRNGNLVPTVDYRSVYATMLERWFGADADGILGASYGRLDLFRGHPGDAAPPIPAGQMSTIDGPIGGTLQPATRVATGVPVG
jgi:uncharacterized protein (DUF1501 family)